MPIILVADDEEDQEELILQRFSGKPFLDGYEFVFARNGPDAWRKIQERPEIEMALLDINMPGMDGLTLLGKIKDARPEMTSVIVSAYGDMTNIRSAMNKGAYDFLTKPIDLNDLEITLKKSLAQVRQVKETAKTERENQSLKIKTVEL
ncbi:MAG TPA: response regulator [Saprospiraceae bacterium]|nr:response regulator [Saprospiraceae bacterium]HNT19150.1 response regulator [Saprospiraceae bacterium]